jgi:hypothetical protein
MLARNALIDYLLDHHGYCDRPMEPRNLCYWGPGCLKTGLLGRGCPHWHPIEGEQLYAIILASTVQS